MKVMKFGGTSVGKPERMQQVANLVLAETEPKIVVLSALSGTTNTLVEICNNLALGNKAEAKNLTAKLNAHYIEFVNQLLTTENIKAKANAVLTEHFEFLSIILKISYSEALSKDILAQGELLSTKLFSLYLEEKQVNHVLISALDYMTIDGNEEPQLGSIRVKLSQLLKQHVNQTIFITQGYICRNAKGEIDNLKRGGSDYTASLIAAAINASVCEIWTDIDGMHNNDPRIVSKTIPVEVLSFDEAAELAYFGAKILHPTCIWPTQQQNVPVRLLNTMQPKALGTTIAEQANTVGVKAVAAKDGITAIKIKSSRMLLAYGFLRKVFEVFEKYKTSIDMITTSEVAVSVTIDSNAYLKEITEELKAFGTVEVIINQSIISIVGNQLAIQEKLLQNLFTSLSNIPITMVSFGGSNHNISLLVSQENKVQTLQNINSGLFGLS